MSLLRGLEMETEKMTLDEIKKLLEEKYEMRLRWNELEPDENPYEVVEVIEEIYSNIFGYDEFDEFIKRKEEAQKSFDPLKYHMGLLSGSSGAIEDCLL